MKKLVLVTVVLLSGLLCFGQQTKAMGAKNGKISAKPAFVKSQHRTGEWQQLSGNWTATDINGNSHDLQAYLSAGKTVFVDLFGYWCSPCWSFHTSGVMEDFMEEYADEAVALMVEVTSGCTLDILQGGGQSQGDWTNGGTNPLPIIMDADCFEGFFGGLTEGFVPSFIVICPSGYAVLADNVPSSVEEMASYIDACGTLTGAPVVEIVAPAVAPQGQAVTFACNVTSLAEVVSYSWTFNGGTPETADTETASVVFDELGIHTVTLAVANVNGSTEVTFDIEVVDCAANAITTFPYTQDFEGLTDYPACWSVIYTSEDNAPFVSGLTFQDGTTTDVFVFSSAELADDYNQYLITPEITTTAPLRLSASVLGYYGDETFRFGYSTTTNDISAFTWGDEILVGGEAFETHSIYVPANVKYVALNYTSIYWYYLLVDEITLEAIDYALLDVTPTEMSFNVPFGNTPVNTANIVGLNLTEAVVATATENFEVSANGTDFAATADFDQNGGTLYVRYNPAEAGEHTGTVTLTSGETTATITLSGVATACENITEFPFEEDFENGISNCWLKVDADGDGYEWRNLTDIFSTPTGNAGSANAAASESYSNSVGVLTPDNWLITPAFEIPAGSNYELTFFVAAQDANYPAEHYAVYISTTTAETSAFQLVYEETINANGGSRAQGTWKQKHVDLASYAGQTIYVAWRHFNCSDEFVFLLDDVYVGMKTAAAESVMSEVAVYPNPANDIVTIANVEGSNVVVLNALGQVVSEINNASANQTIDLSNFANGTYFVKANGQVVKFNVVK